MSYQVTRIKPEKEQMVEFIKDKFEKSQIIILTNYRGELKTHGLTVKEVSGLREKIKESGSEYKVLKNTLAQIAVRDIGIEALGDYFVEPTAVIFGYKDPVATAKAILDFKKEADKDRNHLPLIKAVYMNGKFLSAEELDTLATLPPKEVLLSQLLGAIKGPVQNLAGAFSAPLRDFVNVLQAIVKQKEENK
ncbi:MAG TPA: 50S ribosomal protein L10 [Candidatus Eremiobacteraeota bacterium]|nr:50S ribosomal protein L10 [Candidatus Eremiobacteraeota bacterium]